MPLLIGSLVLVNVLVNVHVTLRRPFPNTIEVIQISIADKKIFEVFMVSNFIGYDVKLIHVRPG